METRMNGEGAEAAETGEGEPTKGDFLFDSPAPPAPSKPDPPVEMKEEGGDLIGEEVKAEEVGTQAAGEVVKEEIEKDLASSDLDLATDPNTRPAPPKTSFSSKFKKGVKKVAKGATTKAKERSGGPVSQGKPSKPSSTGAQSPRKVAPMATHKKGAETANGDVKQVGMNVSEDVAKNVRRFQAKMQLESGEKTSYSDAIGKAVEIALAAE